MPSDWKPQKRHNADVDEWKILRKLKLGPCRVCGRSVGLTLHHLVGRDLGGDDLPDNLVPLCGSGTSGCHGAVEHRSRVACQLLRVSLTAREVGYVLRKKDGRFLDRYYPTWGTEESAA